jgi:hypothetical protein
MKGSLVLYILGMATVMLGLFSTSGFGKLNWATVPWGFRWAVGASQFFFLVAGILFGVASGLG